MTAGAEPYHAWRSPIVSVRASLPLSDVTVWPRLLLVFFPSLSVAVGGRGHCPGLYCSSAKESVDRRPQQVDGGSDVENHLPLFDGVLQPFDRVEKVKELQSTSLTSHQVRYAATLVVYCSGQLCNIISMSGLPFVYSQCPLVDTAYNPALTIFNKETVPVQSNPGRLSLRLGLRRWQCVQTEKHQRKQVEEAGISYRFSELTCYDWSNHAGDGGKGVGDSEQDPSKPACTHAYTHTERGEGGLNTNHCWLQWNFSRASCHCQSEEEVKE